MTARPRRTELNRHATRSAAGLPTRESAGVGRAKGIPECNAVAIYRDSVKGKQTASQTVRLRPPVLAFAILMVVPTACSSKKDASGNWATSFSNFQFEVRVAADPWASGISKFFVGQLAQAQSAGEVLTQSIPSDSAALVQSACSSLKALSKQAGSGNDKTTHLDEAHDALDRLLRDSVAVALLREVLSQTPEQRDRDLGLLSVRAVGPDGQTELTGLPALQDAGLADAAGQISIPPLDSPPYVKYRDWARLEAPKFDTVPNTLRNGPFTEIKACASEP